MAIGKYGDATLGTGKINHLLRQVINRFFQGIRVRGGAQQIFADHRLIDFARTQGGIAVLTDRHISSKHAAIPMLLVVSAINQRLIKEGLRLDVSLVVESGQSISSHHIAATLGFGASAIYPLGVQMRAEEKFGEVQRPTLPMVFISAFSAALA